MKTRQIKLIWPEHLWYSLVTKAKKDGTSLQTLITEAVLDKYGIPHWRKDSKVEEIKQVQEILEKYNYVPEDLQRLVNITLKELTMPLDQLHKKCRKEQSVENDLVIEELSLEDINAGRY